MNVRDYRFLLSEQAALEKLIGETSQENVIGRMSLENRLRDVVTQLEAYQGYSSDVIDARLTFSGEPVSGSRGIWMEFAGVASRTFQAAVIAVGVGNRSTLPPRGRIPNGDDCRLMITGTVPGSFGFQVEDASQQLRFIGESSPVELAIEQIQSILAASVGTDEQLTDAVADTDQRAISALSDFLKTVADGSAVCTLMFKDNEFRFRDTNQVRRSQKRLSRDIVANDVILIGHFRGFLPDALQAEFHIKNTEDAKAGFLAEKIGTVIRGKVESSVAEHININENLGREFRVHARTRRVGPVQPRFTFITCEIVESEPLAKP